MPHIGPNELKPAGIEKTIKDWTEIVLSTMPADKPRAEQAVWKMYYELGLPSPMIVWTKSPFANSICKALINSISETCLSGQIIACKLGNLSDCLEYNHKPKFIDTVEQYQKSYLKKVSGSLNEFINQESGNHSPEDFAFGGLSFTNEPKYLDKDEKSAMRVVMEQAKTTVWTYLNKIKQENSKGRQRSKADFITESLSGKVAWAKVWACIDKKKLEISQDKSCFETILTTESEFWEDQWDNHLWQSWSAFKRVVYENYFGGCEESLGLKNNILDAVGGVIEYNYLKEFSEVCKSAGRIIPCENICFISERHNIIKFDDMGLLHCEDGPALAYPDGYEAYLWHGTAYPADWASNKPDASTALKWRDLEQRRIACEMIGWDKIIEQLDVKIIDRDVDPEIGELINVMIPDVGKEFFLRVTCGTGRQFALPVPPSMTTALEANAWTWGLSPSQYQPEIRT